MNHWCVVAAASSERAGLRLRIAHARDRGEARRERAVECGSNVTRNQVVNALCILGGTVLRIQVVAVRVMAIKGRIQGKKN